MGIQVIVRGVRAIAAVAVLSATLCTTTAFGQTTKTAESDSVMRIGLGRSTIVRTDNATKRVAITDPKIADVQVLSPTQVLVSGKGIGLTDLIIWNANDEAQRYEVVVGADRAAMSIELKRLFPDADIALSESKDAVVLTGTIARAEHSDRLHKYFEAAGIKYVDMTNLAGGQQVQIKVMVAEANRVAIRSLGVNAFVQGGSVTGGAQIGPDIGGALNPTTLVPGEPLSISPATTLFGIFDKADLSVFVQALAENQYLRVLAEPTLTAMSGEEASFLAGGEFPIPVVQGTGGATSTSVSIDYKRFGVQLKFRPTVLGDGSIRLHVAPEVSELSNVGAVTLQGFSIPGILSRRAETTIEMQSGQTFGLAGLISQSTQARSSRIPGIGDVPVLGALFRSVRYRQGDTELLIIVTASLVDPLSVAKRPPVPGEFYVVPNDWEIYAQGRVEGAGTPTISRSDARWLTQNGLDRLKGPGAWANFDMPASVGNSDITSDATSVHAPAVRSGNGK